ncbi:hypothetical protein J4573_45905 [Actinomadura barringtoniae]|uniref:Uncharacterized protein n=1 Tax=Actinomadura barringtoniae TaxID=1427535 RepID=A0A939TCE8_9ACTN|nr:hypothetical protein [Actinomadura barringtoniae]MBO2454492.1 hypothetical protein [Actinomadura barringtoniae]
MDDLERDVAEQLRTLLVADPPPAGLAERILTRTAARRRRRRAVAAAGAFVVCGAVVVGVAGARNGSDPAPAAVAVAPPSAVTIQRGLAGGQRFKAMALGSDGTVLGTSVSVGSDGASEPRGGVWTAGPSVVVPRRVQSTGAGSLPYLWTMAVGDRVQVWPEGERLKCLGPNGVVRTIGDGWSGRDRFYTERGLVVWGRVGGRGVAVASGCDGPTRTILVKGLLKGFSYPLAFVSDGVKTWQVDVRSGAKSAVPRAPRSPDEIAAGPNAIAWVVGDDLTIRDRATGAERSVRLPAYESSSNQVSVGAHVVVYSGDDEDGDGGRARVYDVRTGSYADERGPALAAGGWLLVQAGDVYKLSRR